MISPSSATGNINDSFFKGHYKEVWRRLIPPGLSEAECDFIEQTCGLQKGDAVLDMMCGYGRHALELARRGYAVTAVDNLQEYVEEINSVRVLESLPVEAVADGILQATLSQSYKSIICMGNSFAFFNKEEARFLLQKISAHLHEQGVFILNSWMIAEIAIRHFKEKDWLKVDGYKYLLEYQFAFFPARIESEHTVISPEGEVEVIHGVDYIFTLDELQELLNEAGLEISSLYSTPRKKPFAMGDSRIYIVIKKREALS